MYADVILDIQAAKLDRYFEYIIPDSLHDAIEIGTAVQVPFGKGNGIRTGYVVGLHDQRRADGYVGEIKPILTICDKALGPEGELVELARWMNHYYGGSFLLAIKTVLPVKEKIKQRLEKEYRCSLNHLQLKEQILECKRKGYHEKQKVYEAFLEVEVITSSMLKNSLCIKESTLAPMVQKGQILENAMVVYRNGAQPRPSEDQSLMLNETQITIADSIMKRYENQDLKPSYIHGVTGSGKTNLYIELTKRMLAQNKQVIVLIPEISLTAQTMLRFYKQFGDQVSFVNSKMSKGERYDQFERAKNGEVSVMIGPRSALFTPFDHIGMILIDEEHDNAYQSEQTPRYSAIETAIHRATYHHAAVVMGSATPSVKSYQKCKQKEYVCYEMKKRAVSGSTLPTVSIVDLREELKAKNMSIFSRELKDAMKEALDQKHQIMLFLNRRGYSGFVSCRSCGKVFECPHCAVSLTHHKDDSLRCHYCGYRIVKPEFCPDCGSPFITGFGIGTEKVDAAVHAVFPDAKTLIMDRDTTSKKDSMEQILDDFAKQKADILIGTQMIVKGHDFPNVTVMGVLAADMTLFAGDFSSSERTFQLITQAAGRAGRGDLSGKVFIQSYQPENFVIQTSAKQDYEAFFEEEIQFRKMMKYPPFSWMCEIICFSKNEKKAYESAEFCVKIARMYLTEPRSVMYQEGEQRFGKINDIYRRSVYIRGEDRELLVRVKDAIIADFGQVADNQVWLQFAFQ